MDKTSRTFQVNPIDLLSIPITMEQPPPFHPKRKSKSMDLLDELQKTSGMHPLALQIRAAFHVWKWSILQINFQFLPNLLNKKNTYSIDIIAQDSDQKFHFLTVSPSKSKLFFSNHWPLVEENNVQNQHFVELLVLQHLLPLPLELKQTFHYWLLESNEEGVTRSQIPQLLAQHHLKLGKDMLTRNRELQIPSKRH